MVNKRYSRTQHDMELVLRKGSEVNIFDIQRELAYISELSKMVNGMILKSIHGVNMQFFEFLFEKSWEIHSLRLFVSHDL